MGKRRIRKRIDGNRYTYSKCLRNRYVSTLRLDYDKCSQSVVADTCHAAGSAQLISPPLSGSALSGDTSTTGSPGGSAICMGNMDPEIVGMDFVLTYEPPVFFPHYAVTKLIRIVSSLPVYHISMWLRPILAAPTQILLLRPATP